MNLLAESPQAFSMLFASSLMLSGLLISTISMAIGIGSGILWTPLLMLVYGLTPAEAVATSLAIQTIGLASGSIAFIRTGLVIPRITLAFFAVAFPGVILGSIFSINLDEGNVQRALGIMAMVLAVLFVSSSGHTSEGDTETQIPSSNIRKLLPVPGVLGFFMGMLSIGLTEWLIPLLRHQFKIGMHQAISIVIPMMFLLALTASTTHGLLSDNILWQYFIWSSIGTVIGGQLGVHLARQIKERLLKESFIYLMTLIGIHLIFQSI